MAKSERSRPDKPRKGRPQKGHRPSAAPRSPPKRPRKGQPPAAPAEIPQTRLKKEGRRHPPHTAATPSDAKGGEDAGPTIQRTPFWKRTLDWLLEDPSKAKRDGPTEREKALAKVAAQDRERRRALVRSAFRLRRGERFVEGITFVGPARWPRPPRRVERQRPPRPQATEQLRAKPDTPRAAKKRPKETKRPFPLVAMWHKFLGERHQKDNEGKKVIVPPAETDWRWHTHRFFRSNVRAVVYARSMLLLFLVLTSAWVSLYATTGYDYFDLLAFGPTEDPRDEYKLPFFVIESGSMMHHDASWGRIGTVDPGDIVVMEKYREGMKIETFYGNGDRYVAGAKGDVIMYLPVECRSCGEPRPTIHRAIAYLQRDEYTAANPDPETGRSRFSTQVRFTVEEFGIVNARAVTIPELGLINYQPSTSGYITRGDNMRSNNWADQALGVTPFPVPEDRIIGRMKAEIPVVGLAKIALAGQEPGVLSVDEQWCDFLAGKAACDTWVLFFIVAGTTVGLPLVITSVIFGRRFWQRRLDLIALRQRQAEETAPTVQLDDDPARPPVLIHDATDLLSGKVKVGAMRATSGPTPWQDLTRTHIRHEDD